jgi:hypothetical protein
MLSLRPGTLFRHYPSHPSQTVVVDYGGTPLVAVYPSEKRACI